MTQASALRRSVRAVGRNPRLLRVQAAYALFTTYEMGLWVAVLLWAYSAGGEALAGLVAVVLLVPAAVLAPIGGVIGDRLPRDRALLLTYLLQALAMAALAAAVLAGSRWLVVGVAVIAFTALGWTRPSHYGAAAELSATPEEAAAANSLSGTILGLGYFIGPVIAGTLTAVAGAAAVAAVSVGMALIAAAAVAGLGLDRPVPTDQVDGRLKDGPIPGIGALRAYPAALALLLLVGVEFLAEGCLNLLAVSFASQQLGRGPATAGVLIAVLGAGAVVGGAISVVLALWRRLSLAVCAGLLGAGLPLLLMPLLHSVPVAALAGFVAGAGEAFFAVAGITLLQRTVQPAMMARIFALRESALLGGYAAGAALAPVLVRMFGAGGAYGALGVGLSLLAVGSLPLLVRLDGRAEFRPELVSLLRRVPFLSVLHVDALEGLARRAGELRVPARTVVVQQGGYGDLYYLVADGRLEVSVAGSARRRDLLPGDAFGEIALVRDVPRTATVTAVQPSRLWTIDREAFLRTVAGSAGAELASRHVDSILEPPS